MCTGVHIRRVSRALGHICMCVLECPWGGEGLVSAVGAPRLFHTPLPYTVAQAISIPRSKSLGCHLPVGLRGHCCTPLTLGGTPAGWAPLVVGATGCGHFLTCRWGAWGTRGLDTGAELYMCPLSPGGIQGCSSLE